MKFYAEPNLMVTDFASGRVLLRFDENGEYVTYDETLIKRMKVHFEYEEEMESQEENKPQTNGEKGGRK